MRGILKICGVTMFVALSGCQTIDDATTLVTSGVNLLKDELFSTETTPSGNAQSANIAPEESSEASSPEITALGFVSSESIVDGDTIRLTGRNIRLSGIDAPELKQKCIIHGNETSCGEVAKNALIGFTAGAKVSCVRIDIDRYGRDVSQCFADGMDLSEVMVRSGMAVAYRQYSLVYVSSEAAARERKIGIWGGTFAMPWDWRSQRKQN